MDQKRIFINAPKARNCYQVGLHKPVVSAGQEQALLTKLLKLTGVAYAELNYTVEAQ